MGERQFKPGHRSGALSPYGQRKLSEDRYAWVRTFLGQFVILLDRAENDNLMNVTLYHPRERGAAVALGLTELTIEELDAMKELIDRAFELARPTARRRDEEAHEAFQRGDDSYARSYRSVPQLVYRKGTLDQYREGVQERPEPVAADATVAADYPDAGVDSDDVAEQHSPGRQSQDDGPTAD